MHAAFCGKPRNDETATTVLLHLAAAGNVHTTTCRAFTAAEMDKIVATNQRA